MEAYEGYKQCSKCKCVYPVSCFNRDKHCSDGLKNTCKFCISEYSKKWYILNRERAIKYNQQRKYGNKRSGLCTVCGKNPIAFYRSFTKCEQCLEKHNASERNTRQKLLMKGICRDCRKQPIAHPRSSYLCDDCLDRANYFWKYRNGYYPDLEKELEEVRKYMEEKNENSRI